MITAKAQPMWLLKKDGEVLATHVAPRQCIIEAYERGLVGAYRGKRSLVEGVTIEEASDVRLR